MGALIMAINLNDYEDVASLNKWFQGNFPMGSLRIIKQEHHIMTDKDGNILDEIFVVQTGAFRDANDPQPAITNVARGRQSEYPKHMARFFAEDVTTSSYGRSIALLKATDKTATKDDMKNLSYKTALEIYKADYWNAQNLGELSDQNVANIIYDGCVNQGSDAMRSIVRDALEENGIEISDNDVIFSKKVLSKANGVDQVELFNSIKKFRESRYKESDTFGRHGEGWLNRLDNISYEPQETSSDKA
jgi:hypothetical protein